MKSSTKIAIALLVVVILLVSACAAVEIRRRATPTPLPTDTPIPAPTDTPEPEPTDTPEPEPTDTPEPEPTDTPEPEPTDTPEPEPAAEVLPYDGQFEGTLSGDNNSSASLSLDLTQDGDAVSGTATIGDGAQVALTGLLCPVGVQPLPASSVPVEGTVLSDGSLESKSTIEVSGFPIEVVVTANVSDDNSEMDVLITVNTPPVCPNPELPATLERVGGAPAAAAAEPTDTPEPEPTDTPEPEPTDTPEPEPAAEVLPYDGQFEGTLSGDNNSSASLSLDLTQDGDAVSGTATIGDGAQVALTGLLCPVGVQPLPASSVPVEGTVLSDGSLESKSTIEVSGFPIEVVVTANVSDDNSEMDVLITVNTPPVCPNPELPATLERVGGAPAAAAAPEPTPTPEPEPEPTATPTPEPEPEAKEEVLPFNGQFEGTLSGDNNSSASLSLDLTQDGDAVSGTATIGDGAQVALTGLLCPVGVQPLPASSVPVEGTVLSDGSLESKSTIEVSGFPIEVVVTADVSADNSEMDVLITVNTPPVCPNPELPATLSRQ